MAGGVISGEHAHGHGHAKEAHHHGGHHGNYLTCSHGFKSWAFTLDHKRIGLMYLVGVLIAFFLGGMFAMILRTELVDGAPGTIFPLADSNNWYNQMFTLHGAVMVFLFMIPGLPAAIGNFVLPIQIGAKDVAFPRLNLFSYYLYVTGAILFIIVLATGGLDTGWTMYAPYNSKTSTNVLCAMAGAFILGFSSILTGLNFIATVHKLRAPGMGWFQMPLFIWALYATALIQVIATPVLGILLGLGIMERAFHVGIFLPEYGGDPVLFQHFFWFYSHPAVYIMVLPAMGVISEVIGTFSRKPLFGYKFIAGSSVAIALIGFVVWGHHMFVSGQSKWANIIFSGITFTVAVPSAIKVFAWTATLYKGAIDLKTPMIFGLSFLFLFGIGGLTGLFLAAVSTNVHLHDTYYIIAHFHMVMVGSVLTGFLAALHYWWPKMTGKMYNETLGRIAAVLVFIGFNATFLPQFVAGTLGMPRRYANYPAEFTSYHMASTIGAYILGAAMFLQFGYLLYSLFKGPKAPANPWGAATLEWQADSPPDFHNFTTPPIVGAPYDYKNIEHVNEASGWRLKKESKA